MPDKTVSLESGAVEAWRKGGKRMNIYYNRLIKRFCRNFGISKAASFSEIDPRIRKILLYGTTPADETEFGVSFEGVIPNLARRWENTTSEFVKARLHGYLSEQACRACQGARLRPEAIAVTVGGRSIHEVSHMSIEQAQRFFDELQLDAEQTLIAAQPLKEIKARLRFMSDVGLGYLTLDRTSRTLSGGEAQRIRLATQVAAAWSAAASSRRAHNRPTGRQRPAVGRSPSADGYWQHRHRRRHDGGHPQRLHHRYQPGRRGYGDESSRPLWRRGYLRCNARLPASISAVQAASSCRPPAASIASRIAWRSSRHRSIISSRST